MPTKCLKCANKLIEMTREAVLTHFDICGDCQYHNRECNDL